MDEFGANSLLSFLDGHESQMSQDPATPPSQLKLHALVGMGSGDSPTDSTRTPSSATEPACQALPAGAAAFRRRTSSKNMDSAEKPQASTVPRAPLYKSASTTSNFEDDDNAPLAKKDLAEMFNQVSEAKARVDAEPADKKAKKKQPEAGLYCRPACTVKVH